MAVTAKQLEQEFGVTRRTLHNYTKLGLIPAPLNVSPGARTGVIAVWHNAVRELLRAIHALQTQGKRLDEIARELRMTRPVGAPSDAPTVSWTTPLERWPAHAQALLPDGYLRNIEQQHPQAPILPTNQSGPPPTALQVLRVGIWHACFGVLRDADVAAKGTGAACEPASFLMAVTLVASGYNAVLVLRDGTAFVTADFMVPHEISEDASSAVAASKKLPPHTGVRQSQQPLILIPITRLVRNASAFTTDPFPEYDARKQVVTPSPEIYVHTTDDDALLGFRYRFGPSATWPQGPLQFSVDAETGRVLYAGSLDGIAPKAPRRGKQRKTRQ